jgi:hypothetical protein
MLLKQASRRASSSVSKFLIDERSSAIWSFKAPSLSSKILLSCETFAGSGDACVTTVGVGSAAGAGAASTTVADAAGAASVGVETLSVASPLSLFFFGIVVSRHEATFDLKGKKIDGEITNEGVNGEKCTRKIGKFASYL